MRKPGGSTENLVKMSLAGGSVDKQRRRFIAMIPAGAMMPLAGASGAAPAGSMPIKAVASAQALDAAAATLGIATTATDRDVLVAAFFQMELWPDVVRLLGDFQQRGLRLAFLTNLSEAMLRSNMRPAGIEHFFQAALSTDRARAFKPAPEAYQLGVEEFGLQKRGGRVRGVGRSRRKLVRLSDRMGHNRLGQQAESLGAPPAVAGRDLAVLDDLLH